MDTFQKFRSKPIKEQSEESEETPATEETMEPTKGIAKPKTLDSGVEEILNERLGDEYTAYYFYRNAANWCKNVNYKKATEFFNSEAEGELGHAQGIQDYLTQWNLIPSIPSAPSNQSFTSLIDIINKAYNLEYGLFMKYSKDQQSLLGVHPATFNFIQKYVDIQNDSVAEYSDLLNALQLVNIENKLDVLIFEDKYFG